jgi:ankyrin repeat protein
MLASSIAALGSPADDPEFSPNLIAATVEGDREAMERALAEGESVNGVDGNGQGALHAAAIQMSEASIAWLLSRGADANLRGLIDGQTPLHALALLPGDEQAAIACAQRFAQAGALPDALDADGLSAFLAVWDVLGPQAAEPLLGLSPRFSLANRNGESAVHLWVRAQSDVDPKAARLDWLVERAAAAGDPLDFNAPDAKGLTPLDCAVEHRRARAAAALAERGARMSEPFDLGWLSRLSLQDSIDGASIARLRHLAEAALLAREAASPGAESKPPAAPGRRL